jgi:hypothetical protein
MRFSQLREELQEDLREELVYLTLLFEDLRWSRELV